MKSNFSSERGQALILIAIGIVGLLGLVALAVDGGNAFMDRRHAQNAADAAAIAAGYAKISNQDPSPAALAMAASNNYNNDGSRSTVTLVYPPGVGCNGETGPYAGNNEYLQVIIHSYLDTFFAQVVGIPQIHNCVEAIARVKPPYTAPMFNGNAMVALNPTDCMAFDAGGDSGSTVSGSGIFVNSSSDCGQGAFRQHGNGLIATEGICVIGSYSYDPGKVSPAPTNSGCDPVEYPPELIWPTPSCSGAATYTGTAWNPGFIDGKDLRGNLNPGVYCVDGNVTINASDTLVGNGVLIYMMNGTLHINGGAFILLTAPTTGDFAGLLIYYPFSNTNDLILNGNASSVFMGTILAPASEIQINGTGSTLGYQTQIIGYYIELVGDAATVIHYDDGGNYDATVPPSIEIVR